MFPSITIIRRSQDFWNRRARTNSKQHRTPLAWPFPRLRLAPLANVSYLCGYLPSEGFTIIARRWCRSRGSPATDASQRNEPMCLCQRSRDRFACAEKTVSYDWLWFKKLVYFNNNRIIFFKFSLSSFFFFSKLKIIIHAHAFEIYSRLMISIFRH